MARSRQSLKRLRTDKAKAKRNHSRRRSMRTAIKRVRDAETTEERETALRRAQSLIDRAGRTRLIHPNKADRLKRQLHTAE